MKRLFASALFALFLLSTVVPRAEAACTIAVSGDTTATVTWTVPTTDVNGHAIPSGTTLTFNLYRGTASGAEAKYQTGLTGTSFADTNLAYATTYYYTVTAVDPVGEGPPSTEACKTIAAAPLAAPAAPDPVTVK